MKSLILAATFSTAILLADSTKELQEKELKEIESAIEARKEHLKVVELDEMRSEMQAQNYFFDQWSKFSDSMEYAERLEHEAAKLKDEIGSLEKRRDEINRQTLDLEGKHIDEKSS